MEYAVCGKKAKSLDPVVLHQLNKKYAGIVGDYAIVEVVNDNEKGEISIKVSEADSTRFTKPIIVSNSMWKADYNKIEIVMLKLEDSMNYIEKQEMDDLVAEYRKQHAETADVDNNITFADA